MRFDRDPKGRWIDQGSAIYCWLPLLLNLSYREPVTHLLNAAARYCHSKAAGYYESLAARLKADSSYEPANSYLIRQAERCHKIREILLDAKERIEAL